MQVQDINSLRPRQNGRHFADAIFKCIFLNENVWIPIKISLKFVPKGPFNDIPALVQIMAWRRPGDKPLSEPMLVSLPTHICVTRPQWVNSSPPGQYGPRCPLSPKRLINWISLPLPPRQNGRHFGRQQFQMHLFNENDRIPIWISLKFVLTSPIDNKPALVQVMAWHRRGDKQLPEPMLT